MSNTKKPVGWDELAKQRNPALFLAERMEELKGKNGWHGKAQCAIPAASLPMCKMAESHAECITNDVYVSLRTLGKLIEGYTCHDNPTYDDDHLAVLSGVGTMTRLLADALEVSSTLEYLAGDGIYLHGAIKAADGGSHE